MTVVGHGDIASAIPAHLHPNWCWFASGVSNSQETDRDEFDFELGKLGMMDSNSHLVYFSSLCVFYADTAYARHKREMESKVRSWFRTWTIVRLGNITWGTNPHTLINHLRAQAAAGLPLDVQPVERTVHTLDDFHYTLGQIPDWSCELHGWGRRLTVRQIVDEFVLPVPVPDWTWR
jgi:hypothetical protein